MFDSIALSFSVMSIRPSGEKSSGRRSGLPRRRKRKKNASASGKRKKNARKWKRPRPPRKPRRRKRKPSRRRHGTKWPPPN